MPLQPSDYDKLFVDGLSFQEPNGNCCTVYLERGSLSLSSGRVAAVEPGYLGVDSDIEAFTQTVSPGRYSVVLAVVEYRSSVDAEAHDERVAAARLVIRGEPVTSWEFALLEGQDPAELGPEELFGYPVDGGTGCFADPDVVQRLLDDDAEDLFEVSADVYDRPTSATEVEGPDGEPAVVAFSTGGGDGGYPTWVGRTEGGEVACFLTDFFLWPPESSIKCEA